MRLKKYIKLLILSVNDMSKVFQMYEKGLQNVVLILEASFKEQDEVIKILISAMKIKNIKVVLITFNKPSVKV